ncbi:MAG: hypothetical protein V7707_09015 [Motiliproteus sp.]
MKQLIRLGANVAAILGVSCCVAAAFARLRGAFYLPGGIEAISLFELGTGMMVFACLGKLELLLQREAV